MCHLSASFLDIRYCRINCFIKRSSLTIEIELQLAVYNDDECVVTTSFQKSILVWPIFRNVYAADAYEKRKIVQRFR